MKGFVEGTTHIAYGDGNGRSERLRNKCAHYDYVNKKCHIFCSCEDCLSCPCFTKEKSIIESKYYNGIYKEKNNWEMKYVYKIIKKCGMTLFMDKSGKILFLATNNGEITKHYNNEKAYLELLNKGF